MIAFPHVNPQLVHHWLKLGSVIAGGLAVVAGTAAYIIKKRQPTAEQREERRRKRLSTGGRIIDGSLVDVTPAESEPHTLIYRYRIAGVTYECSQDVSAISQLVQNIRVDYPVQVRYNRQNPADSIVVSETWNGLWTNIWTTDRHGRRIATH